MAGTGGNEPDRAGETSLLPESAPTGFREVAKVASIAIDLRDGFRNERRTPEYRAIHGLSPDANDTHEDWVARLHPEDRERTVRQFLDAVKGPGEQFSYQYRIIRPNDGNPRWIATEARIERDSTAGRCGWSARTSTSPSLRWPGRPCARAKSGFA